MKTPSHKKQNKNKKPKKTLHSYPQCIDRDVRAPEGRNPNPIHQKDVRVYNWCSCSYLAPNQKLHYTSEAHSELDNEPFNKAKTDIMNNKIQEIVARPPQHL